jgi:hypothetical protein
MLSWREELTKEAEELACVCVKRLQGLSEAPGGVVVVCLGKWCKHVRQVKDCNMPKGLNRMEVADVLSRNSLGEG